MGFTEAEMESFKAFPVDVTAEYAYMGGKNRVDVIEIRTGRISKTMDRFDYGPPYTQIYWGAGVKWRDKKGEERITLYRAWLCSESVTEAVDAAFFHIRQTRNQEAEREREAARVAARIAARKAACECEACVEADPECEDGGGCDECCECFDGFDANGYDEDGDEDGDCYSCGGSGGGDEVRLYCNSCGGSGRDRSRGRDEGDYDGGGDRWDGYVTPRNYEG